MNDASHLENALEKHQEVLASFAQKVKEALKHNLIGFYVTGSFVGGSWNTETSDVDVCIVIKEALTRSEAQALQDIHEVFCKDLIGRKLEGEYVTLASLQAKDYGGEVGTVVNGVFSTGTNNLSHDNLVGLNQKSIALVGPAFQSFGITITKEELEEAEYEMLCEDKEEAKTAEDFEKKLYLLINSLRCLFTLRTGTLPTKKDALEAGRSLIDEKLYQNLRVSLSGKTEAFEISSEVILSVIDVGLNFKKSEKQ